jgi:hypothetical protein
MSDQRIPDHLKDVIAGAANLAAAGGGVGSQQVEAHRAQRYALMEYAAQAVAVVGRDNTTGMPLLFISQRSHKTDLVESDVVLQFPQAVIVFCQLLAAQLGMNVAFTPMRPDQGTTLPQGTGS